jgi:NIMA (never in mitosis gene a)-related kinase
MSLAKTTKVRNYEILSMLGEGTYSKVYKARRVNSDLILALKQIEICNFEGKELENILNEIRILSCIRHQNILEYIESFIDFESKTLCIVTELADYGDLFECISWFRHSKNDINERDIWVIIFQILRGLKTLHNNKIIHRDLKSANIFLFSNGSVKIGDMNVSAVVSNTNNLATTQTGTPYYSSPEIWDDVPYSYKSDMWSLGCLIYEMCALKVPFDGDNIYQ